VGLVELVFATKIRSLTLTSIDPTFSFTIWEALPNPDVYLIERVDDRWSIERVWNA